MTSNLKKSKSVRSPLTKHDRTALHAFGITDEWIESAGIYRVTDAQAREQGFESERGRDLSGIVFPYRDRTGVEFNARLRRDHPEQENGKTENKYISKPGDRYERGLYWPPSAHALLKKPKTEVVLVEAEKSALACQAAAERAGRNLISLAMGGYSGWRDAQRGVVPDLNLIYGRTVHLLLDSNIASNEQVQEGELALAEHLAHHETLVDCIRLPALRGVNGPDDYLSKEKPASFWKLFTQPVEPWLEFVGESYEKYLAAEPPQMLIKDFLQTDGVTCVGGPAGKGKTYIILSVINSLLTGQKLFGEFDVIAKAKRVIYLTPEVSMGAFKFRAEKFHFGPFIKSKQLIVRTLSAYPLIQLTDPALLLSARGADIFLDPAVRFMEGDESSNSDSDKGFAKVIFSLLQMGARSVTFTHHSPKAFAQQNYMSLENVLRGAGDIGAMLVTAWGVQQIDGEKNVVHMEHIKARDFGPVPPFQIQGKPYIDQGRGFQMVSKPGETPYLAEALPPEQQKRRGGRPKSAEKAQRIQKIKQLINEKRAGAELFELLKADSSLSFPEKYFDQNGRRGTVHKEVGEARSQLGQKF